MTCTPLIVFGRGWAALVITVVVQHLLINCGVRSFFPYENGFDKPVQENQTQNY
jgi:hypothetical protein